MDLICSTVKLTYHNKGETELETINIVERPERDVIEDKTSRNILIVTEGEGVTEAKQSLRLKSG